MRVEDSSFRKNETGTSCILYAEGITKTRQSGLHQKSRLQLLKMFERCPVKLFQKYLLKCPVGMQKSGPLVIICKSFNKPLVYKTPMGINNINSMMKDLMSNSTLQKSEKHLANHSSRKTLGKKIETTASPKI